MRNTFKAIRLVQGILAVNADPPADRPFLQEAFDRRQFLICDREEPYRFITKLLRQLVEVGNGEVAGPAPSGPEFQNHRFSCKGGEPRVGGRLGREERVQFNGGCGLADFHAREGLGGR